MSTATTTQAGTTVTAAADDGADGHRTPVPLPVGRFDDPHQQPLTRHPRRAEGFIVLFFLIGIAGVAAFGGAYWQDATPWILGVTLGAGLFGLGFGLTAWGKYLMPRGPFVEERHTMASEPDEREAMAAALVERSGIVVKRRKLLGGLLAGGLGIFGIVALFPLLRSLGPLPGDTLEETDWRRHTYLVDINGRRIHRDQMRPGGILTVYPEGLQNTDDGQAVDQTVLIRVQETDLTTKPGRKGWGPTGYVAYSKMCTHLGCPVGLYERELEMLVCPCHQSMFNVREAAIPVFGPAPRPLPQLPLYIDRQGYIRARSGYDQAVGPGYWERTNKGNGPGATET
ncbi:MAG TPA: Rieske 2Fe-2S domain-containing protein [Acidimicrobiales bacterium]|nr:Rieske 2Fe-2S domain-containing protein [Acidimicrobiales bacterium]